jgi:prophage regulatory protein
MPRKILTFDELADHGVYYSRRQVDRIEADPNIVPPFPRRVRLGLNRVGWVTVEIDAYVNALITSRSTKAGTLGSAGGVQRKRGPKPNAIQSETTA